MAAERQPLNPLDVALHYADQAIRESGYPGFETQLLAWLRGRIDLGELRGGLERLGKRYPVLTAHLAEDGSGLFWAFQPEATPLLNEIDVPIDNPDAVFACAEGLLLKGRALSSAPLDFHVLHRPGGQDVLLMQYSHVLMDNRAAGELLRELDQLSDSCEEHDVPCREPGGLVRDRLKRVPASQRRAAALRAVENQRVALRGGVAVLGKGAKATAECSGLRIASRVLHLDETQALQASTVRLCGLPALSMTILATAFRAIHNLDRDRRNLGRNYVAGIGLDMGFTRSRQPRLQNLLSVVPIMARSEELADRDELVRRLSRQMHDRLHLQIDVGALALAAIFQRRPQHISMVVEHLIRRGYSLWYAYFGAADFIGHRLLGLDAEKICYVGPTWLPMGISLLVNQFRGQLHFQATYDPELVTEELAGAFLDLVLSELSALASGHSS